jgi:hypothetical protein
MKTTVIDQASGTDWTAINGDCIEVVSALPSDSMHFSVYSPPFCSLYTYSASERDLGNCRTHEEFHEHYRFLLGEMLRVTKPGRNMSVHCMDLPTSKTRDGEIGLTDFPGEIIRSARAAGWIWHSKVTIRKDPVTAMQRTKALGLLHKQIKKDSCMSRMGIPDYVLTFRKPGQNPEPVAHTPEEFPVSLWQQWAEPTWTITDTDKDLEMIAQYAGLLWDDINPGDTLQYQSAREEKDERHICPIQLEVVRRCTRLWSNPGDTVLSPFMGIGSEGHVALELGRKFVGVELKPSYYKQAVANLAQARRQGSLFEAVSP